MTDKELDMYDTVDFEECQHENITEDEFRSSCIHKMGKSVIVAHPHTVKFKCIDCQQSIPIFVLSGVFNY